MAETAKPADINKIWSASGDILAPSDTKISQGWGVEIPPRQWFNYIDNKQDAAIAHINQHGIAVWDSLTEYQWSSSGTKSLVMGSNGTIYRAKQVSINQNPVLDTTNVYWETAFASLADVYTKAQVDAKTTIASAAQAQALSLNTVLLTPLQLNNAFQGANQNLVASGFQKHPGGLVEIWGTVAIPINTGAGSVTVAMPTSFPNAFMQAVATFVTNLGGNGGRIGINCPTNSTIQIDIAGVGTTTGTENIRYRAWGR